MACAPADWVVTECATVNIELGSLKTGRGAGDTPTHRQRVLADLQTGYPVTRWIPLSPPRQPSPWRSRPEERLSTPAENGPVLLVEKWTTVVDWTQTTLLGVSPLRCTTRGLWLPLDCHFEQSP